MENKINFEEIIDILANEYGWNIEYIQKLSIEEIQKLIKKIYARKLLEYKIQAYVISCGFAGKIPKFGDIDKKEEPKSDIESLKKLARELKIKLKPIKKEKK